MKQHKLIGAAALGAAILLGSIAVWNPLGWSVLYSLHGVEDEHGLDEAKLYTCGMHPHVIQEGPGQCPICGMDLTRVKIQPAADAPGPAGVRVSRNFVQNFAVRTAEVVRDDLAVQIRTVGYLDQNEERLTSVNTKFAGWIERARVNTVGEKVSKGQLLFEIYSPQLVIAQQEYLAAMGFVERLRASGAYAAAVGRAESLLSAAGERLRHWDLTAEQVDRLRSTREVARTLEFYSPAAGFIVEKTGDSLEGRQVTPGLTVLKIADHSSLWAKVEFYEHHVRDLRTGLRAAISVDAFPGLQWNGEVLFFRPTMNQHTQTLTGYVEVDNANGLLRPQMYATVLIRLQGVRNALIVPTQSVLHSGDRAVVVVDGGDGLFVPREVQLGIESEGRFQVLDGLAAGERVVTSSQFLIDSESNLKTAIAQLLEGARDDSAPR